MWPFESTTQALTFAVSKDLFHSCYEWNGPPSLQMRKLKCRRKRLPHMLQAGGSFLEQQSPGTVSCFKDLPLPSGSRKSVCTRVCDCVCAHAWMCQRVYTGLHMYVCTHMWQCCVHTCPTLCTRVCVPVCKVRTPSPLPLPHSHTDQTRLTELQVSSLPLHTAGCLPNGITVKGTDARARLPGFKSCHMSVRGLYLLISKMGFLAPG